MTRRSRALLSVWIVAAWWPLAAPGAWALTVSISVPSENEIFKTGETYDFVGRVEGVGDTEFSYEWTFGDTGTTETGHIAVTDVDDDEAWACEVRASHTCTVPGEQLVVSLRAWEEKIAVAEAPLSPRTAHFGTAALTLTSSTPTRPDPRDRTRLGVGEWATLYPTVVGVSAKPTYTRTGVGGRSAG